LTFIWQLKIQQLNQFLWLMVLDKRSTGPTPVRLQTMAPFFGACIVIRRTNKWNQQLLDGRQ
jgi:hypothetical protein